MRYNVLLTDNSKEGIVINADTLREFFIELDNFMSSNCYYWDDILFQLYLIPDLNNWKQSYHRT